MANVSEDMHQTATSRTSMVKAKPVINPFALLGLPADGRKPPDLKTVARAWRAKVNSLPKPVDERALVELNQAKSLMNETLNWSDLGDWL